MLYTIQNDGLRYWTGRLRDGRQAIVGPSLPKILLYYFDPKGKLTDKEVIDLIVPPKRKASKCAYSTDAVWLSTMERQIADIQAEMGFVPQPIQIQEFYDEDEDIGIKDQPSEFEEYHDAPDDYLADDRASLDKAIRDWKDKQRFVFVWGNEQWMSKDGERLNS